MIQLEQDPIQVGPPSLSNPRISSTLHVPSPPGEANPAQWLDFFQVCLWNLTGASAKQPGDFETMVRMYAKRWDVPMVKAGPQAMPGVQDHG